MSDAPLSLTVLVLTKNEARHIERCLASIAGLAARVVVVDSGSTDATCALAAAAGAEVLSHPWTNYATQFNWAIDQSDVATDWTMRLDADEVVLPGLRASLAAFLTSPGAAVAVTVDRRMHFMGRWIRWGGIYPVPQLRIWRTGRGRCEDRWMDEHMLVDGPVAHLPGDIADINLNTLGWWTEKHNGYATREAADVLFAGPSDLRTLKGTTRIKRWAKERVYWRLPMGIRPLLYFLYRYVLRLGFLDGWQGLIFFTLQVFWYRFLVDAKLFEIRRAMAARGLSAAQVLAADYGLKLPAATD